MGAGCSRWPGPGCATTRATPSQASLRRSAVIGARLAASPHAAGLVEEYRLLVFPDNVGTGKRLVTVDAPHSGFTVLEMTSTGAAYTALAPAPFSIGAVTVEDGREVTTTS